MREEDEIRVAVVALMEAQEAGEDVSAELPSEESLAAALGEAANASDTEEDDPKAVRDRALAAVLDYVRAATRESRLTVPSEWAEAGLVPPSLTPEDLEMAVYDALMEHGDPLGAEGAGETSVSRADAAASHRPTNRHVRSAFSSSNGRPVGASPFKRKADPIREGGPRPAPTEDIPEPTEAPESVDVPESTEVSETPDAPEPTDAPEVSPLAAACAGIRLLMGAESYYLYDSAVMTGTYARWAFLAAEDDPVATFIECVREESQVYPRPMARSNLANAPFRMGAEAVEAAYASAREQGRADDIERTQASNGDVYFYSTAYLSPRRAQALAEWDAVERIRNV